MFAIRNPLQQRFWEKVWKTESCWIWTADRYPAGYGSFAISRSRHRLAHRVAYELVHGTIPAGLTIDHLCRNRACVNPDHLEAVTRKENILRGVGITAINAHKTQCKKGHPLSPENTRIKATGARQCRKCQTIQSRKDSRTRRERQRSAG